MSKAEEIYQQEGENETVLWRRLNVSKAKIGGVRGKRLSTATEDRSSGDDPPSYIDAST